LTFVASLGRLGIGRWAAPEVFPVISQEHELHNAVREATDRLQRELGDDLSSTTIAECVREAVDELSDSRVKTYVPVLAYRLARERLVVRLNTRD
jgi:Protein-tyrosine-phosphatase-like, N-terminal domain